MSNKILSFFPLLYCFFHIFAAGNKQKIIHYEQQEKSRKRPRTC
jgi:hypothetical protein